MDGIRLYTKDLRPLWHSTPLDMGNKNDTAEVKESKTKKLKKDKTQETTVTCSKCDEPARYPTNRKLCEEHFEETYEKYAIFQLKVFLHNIISDFI